jgi:hypothetical protein
LLTAKHSLIYWETVKNKKGSSGANEIGWDYIIASDAGGALLGSFLGLGGALVTAVIFSAMAGAA